VELILQIQEIETKFPCLNKRRLKTQSKSHPEIECPLYISSKINVSFADRSENGRNRNIRNNPSEIFV